MKIVLIMNAKIMGDFINLKNCAFDEIKTKKNLLTEIVIGDE